MTSISPAVSKAPSRQFMIQQAVLNAIAIDYPLSVAAFGPIQPTHRMLGLVRDEFDEGKKFVCRVRYEFAKLAQQYGVAV